MTDSDGRRGVSRRAQIAWAWLTALLAAASAAFATSLVPDGYDASVPVLAAILFGLASAMLFAVAAHGRFTVISLVLGALIASLTVAALLALGGYLWFSKPTQFWTDAYYDDDGMWVPSRWTPAGVLIACVWAAMAVLLGCLSGALAGRLSKLILGR